MFCERLSYASTDPAAVGFVQGLTEATEAKGLLTFPVVVSQSTRLLPDTGPDSTLELVESRATPSAATIQLYRPTRRPHHGTATVDMKHVT